MTDDVARMSKEELVGYLLADPSGRPQVHLPLFSIAMAEIMARLARAERMEQALGISPDEIHARIGYLNTSDIADVMKLLNNVAQAVLTEPPNEKCD